MKNPVPSAVRGCAVAALLACSACATVGTPFTFAGPDSITVGKTTQADLLARYGKPLRVGFDNGSVKWAFGYYSLSLFGDNDTKDLDVIFDKEGVVTSYTYESSDPAEVSKSIQR